ncbi:MAG TPA: hypothetical protein VI636_02825 [Candidatus Angelobacter sp.]
MADIKTTDSPNPDTRQEFPEVKGKIVEMVELTAEPDYFGISIRFDDKTGLAFSFEPCIFAVPTYADWTSGEEKFIKEYRPVRSTMLRE